MSELAALPGADGDAGTGPAVRSLFEGLLEDGGAVRAGAPGVGDVVARHRDGRLAWSRDVLGPVQLPAAGIDGLLEGLTGADRGLGIVLAADASGLDGLRQARNMILEDDRVELVAVHVALPPDLSPPAGARAVLDALDFTAPARVDTALAPGWGDALAVVAADGAEHLAVSLQPLDGPPADVAELAVLVRQAVDRDLTVHVAQGPDDAVGSGTVPGVLNVVCAVRAALNGAGEEDVAAVLRHADAAPLAAAVRRMSDADAALVRSFLGSVAPADPASVVDDLVALGLLDPDDEG